MDNENLFSSSIDDDLFDDGGSNGGQQGGNGNGGNGGAPFNGGTMGGNLPGNNDNNNGQQNNNNNGNKGGRVEDDEIINAMRSRMQGGDPLQGENRNNGNNGDLGGGSGLIINDNDDAISYILKKNMIDPSKISVTGENGEQEEVKFSDLTREEQLDIISSLMSSDNNNGDNGNNDLSDDEIDLISSIRRNRMDIPTFINAIKESAIQQYLEEDGTQYSFSDLSDDDIFINDYKSKVPNATEQECIDALNAMKSNPNSFKRTVDGIRENYKKQEDIIRENNIKDRQEKERERLEKEENLVVDTINKFSNMKIGELTANLSNQDKEDIASFILDSSVSGRRYLQDALNDPETLFKMAWWITKGEDAIDQMQRYYRQQVMEKQTASYKKGYEDAKNGKNMSFVVQRSGRPRNGGHKAIPSLADLDEGLD